MRSMFNLLASTSLCVALLAIAAGVPVGSPLQAVAGTFSRLWSAVAARNRFRLAPAPFPLVRESSLFDDAYREEIFWGTYRPGFYCGAPAPEPIVAPQPGARSCQSGAIREITQRAEHRPAYA